MVESGAAYSTTVKGVGRVQAGWLAQTLYEGFRKWIFLFFLIVIVLITGPPFGMMGAAYEMPPMYQRDELTDQSLPDKILYDWDDTKASLKTMSWTLTVLFSAILVAYISGWVFVARRYSFARTTAVKQKA